MNFVRSGPSRWHPSELLSELFAVVVSCGRCVSQRLQIFAVIMQIASFIKTHIFSRRRPVDGWKYMIEVIGPNARRGKGSVQRLPSLTDSSTQPYKEEKPAIGPNLTSFRGRQ